MNKYPKSVSGLPLTDARAASAKFEREGVGSTITVTSCWCYGSETMDMNPHYPKAVWGFNGTERPGAVYLAAVLAAHAQKGLPAFGMDKEGADYRACANFGPLYK